MAHPAPALEHLHGTLYALQVPIPFPMQTVTVLIDLSPPVTLIDAALNTPDARQATEDALSALGMHWPDIGRVIVTHLHPDHLGLAGLIEERSGAEIQMLDVEIANARRLWNPDGSWLPGQSRFAAEQGLPAHLAQSDLTVRQQSLSWVRLPGRFTPLTAGQTVPLAGADWEVLWLPGHSDGHLGLWQPERGLLIAADAILPRITPNIGLFVDGRPDPLGDYFGTLEKLGALNPVQAIVGHYGPLLGGVAQRAAAIRGHHLERLDGVLAAVAGRALNAYELSLALFTRELPPSGRRFALAEALAHAEHLRLQGALPRRLEDGVWVYG